MKTIIESNGKTHLVRLTAENVFEQAAIDAVQVYQTKTEVYKDDSTKETNDTNQPQKFDTLVIKMEDPK